MDWNSMSYEEFVDHAKAFVELSNGIHDGWYLEEVPNVINPACIKKECFLNKTYKAEYVVSYSMSFGVCLFAFNLWDSNGRLITLEEIQLMSQYKFCEKEIYSAITQQEHPLFFRPFYIVHPCHTEKLLSTVKGRTKNIIVTFLSLLVPFHILELTLDYGL